MIPSPPLVRARDKVKVGIARLRAHRARANAARDFAEMTRDREAIEFLERALELITEAEKEATGMAWTLLNNPDLPDHACGECMPGGELVKPGFRCGLHIAKALKETPRADRAP